MGMMNQQTYAQLSKIAGQNQFSLIAVVAELHLETYTRTVN